MLARNKVDPEAVLKQLSKIVALTKQYDFDDIYLAKPSAVDNTNILFIISKTRLPGIDINKYIRVSVDLHKLLGIDIDHEMIRIKEDLKPEFFDECYEGNMLSLLSASDESVRLFLKNKLNIEVSADPISLSQGTPSQIGKFSNNNKTESLFEEKESTRFSPKLTNNTHSQD